MYYFICIHFFIRNVRADSEKKYTLGLILLDLLQYRFYWLTYF